MCKGRGDCSRDQRWGKGESVVISRGLQICSTELNGSYSADLSPISLGIPSARGVPLSKSQLLIHRYLSTELRESRCGNYGRRSLLCQGFPSACPRRAHWHHVQGVLHWTHVYTCRPQSRAAQHGGGGILDIFDGTRGVTTAPRDGTFAASTVDKPSSFSHVPSHPLLPHLPSPHPLGHYLDLFQSWVRRWNGTMAPWPSLAWVNFLDLRLALSLDLDTSRYHIHKCDEISTQLTPSPQSNNVPARAEPMSSG